MKISFIRKDGPGGTDVDSTERLRVPSELLDRHQGRVLDPGAEVASGWPAPRPTAYRPRVLLIPDDVLRDEARVGVIRQVLNGAGLDVDAPEAGSGSTPRPVLLRPLAGQRDDVDSWSALQKLRAAADDDGIDLDHDVVGRISLEHLLFSAVTITGTPWDTNADSVDGSYRRSPSGTSRVPVSLCAHPPHRGEVGTEQFARRPVIAVLDSGIGPHPWFGIPDRTAPPPPGGFISVLDEAQDAIRRNAAIDSASPVQSLTDYWDVPAESDKLIPHVDSNTGHGTFIAGLIRQAAPRADVLAIRVMHSDGIAYGSDIIAALEAISRRVERAQEQNRPEDMVDVVSLSLGYLDETPADAAYTTHLAAVVSRLTEQGVLVLAASGNHSTSRRFYPAALAELPDAPGAGPGVISVGALNPNTTKALFSNDGAWVTCWATGAGVVSTYPTDVSGPRQAPTGDEDRSGLDPDDFRSGFAVWDGTSFATPLAAAAVANALIDVAASDTGLSLANVHQETVVKRAWAALERCYEQYPV
ncbi:S8 family serine peptidase [Actinosynnema sp. CS-041913]|uniref:S8 family serine peptidase n=1 Tax=Actinosynnema sp. CS-041913 TaxID=3239917 RepID=UPI003D941A1D